MRVENSFIPVRGVGERTERDLWTAGITRWDDVDRADILDITGATVADRIEQYVDVARDHLRRRESHFFAETFPDEEHWRFYENFRDDTCFFDIETTGLDQENDRVTTVSFHRDGETTTLVRGDDLTAGALQEQFAGANVLVTFNGKRFDVPFLETSFDLSIDTPHLDLMYPCRRIGLTGGLKAIEADVGVGRDRPDLSGRDAVRLWRQHERGEDGALETLISYNREDAVNLQTLADHVTRRLHDRTFESAGAESNVS